LLVALPAFLAFGNPAHLPATPMQWAVLGFLGLVSTAFGMYAWNKGASLAPAATLAVMNNLHVPVGLLINLLVWNHQEPLGRLALGGSIILASVWLSRRRVAS
jgi:drug/metabolite transporter (DMT)-like permease